MIERLLLDEHYSEAIAAALPKFGHEVAAAVSDARVRGTCDPSPFRRTSTRSIKPMPRAST